MFCVNDGAVMKAWAKDQQIEKAGGLISFMADPAAELTKALGIELTHPGPASVGVIGRSQRAAVYIEDGEVKVFTVSASEDDPAGDDNPESTCAPALLEAISK